eukprot:236859_1
MSSLLSVMMSYLSYHHVLLLMLDNNCDINNTRVLKMENSDDMVPTNYRFNAYIISIYVVFYLSYLIGFMIFHRNYLHRMNQYHSFCHIICVLSNILTVNLYDENIQNTDPINRQFIFATIKT